MIVLTAARLDAGLPVSARKPAFFFAGLVVLLVILLLNFRGLVAELYAIPSRHLLKLENSQDWRDRDRIYEASLSSIEGAMKWQSDNPEYSEIQGRLLADRCRHWSVVERWADWQQCQAQALASFRAALQGNTRSAYLWANLLLVKYNLSQFDSEFYDALQRCSELGSHEIGVNRIVVYVGFREWKRWSPAQREQFRRALLSMQAASPDQAKKVAEAAGQGVLYCSITYGDPRRHYSCRQKKRKAAIAR